MSAHLWEVSYRYAAPGDNLSGRTLSPVSLTKWRVHSLHVRRRTAEAEAYQWACSLGFLRNAKRDSRLCRVQAVPVTRARLERLEREILERTYPR